MGGDEGGRGAGEGVTKGVDASYVWRDQTFFFFLQSYTLSKHGPALQLKVLLRGK